jgi:hypothetical protein
MRILDTIITVLQHIIRRDMSPEEVERKLQELADGQEEKLNWRGSIVDLCKLLNIDSSLGARKRLAQELGYTGKLDGSAEMNDWLHRAVVREVAERDIKLPG